MELKLQDVEALRRMVVHEQAMTDSEKKLGWEWRGVGVYTATINKLVVAGLVKCTYSSNRCKMYLLTEKGRELAQASPEGEGQRPPVITVFDPATLFIEIVGYDNVKELLREVLFLDNPVHILLYGPPSIAKSMFLIDIEDAAGDLALPLLGSATSHAGMWDLIAERHPRFILIDEIEKMSLQDMAGLLSLMEHQRIIRAKVGRRIEEQVDCRVFAAANRISRLPPELLSRFWKCQLSEYSTSEYVHVVKSILVNREKLAADDAHQVAMRLAGKTHDVRDAIRIARLSKRVGVERALQLWLSASQYS